MPFVDLTPAPTWRDRGWQAAFRLGLPAARAWWSLVRPSHQGALVEVVVGGAVLLLRSSYRPEWGFPGGGVKPGETPEAAARRELREETGLDAAIAGPATVVEGDWDGLRDTVHIFRLLLADAPALRFDNREITGAALVSPERMGEMRLTGPVAAYRSGLGKGCDAARD